MTPQVVTGIDIIVDAVIGPADAVNSGRILGQDPAPSDIAAEAGQGLEKSAPPQHRIAAPAFIHRE